MSICPGHGDAAQVPTAFLLQNKFEFLSKTHKAGILLKWGGGCICSCFS